MKGYGRGKESWPLCRLVRIQPGQAAPALAPATCTCRIAALATACAQLRSWPASPICRVMPPLVLTVMYLLACAATCFALPLRASPESMPPSRPHLPSWHVGSWLQHGADKSTSGMAAQPTLTCIPSRSATSGTGIFPRRYPPLAPPSSALDARRQLCSALVTTPVSWASQHIHGYLTHAACELPRIYSHGNMS